MESCKDCKIQIEVGTSFRGRCAKCHSKYLVRNIDVGAASKPISSEQYRKKTLAASKLIPLTTETFIGDVERLGIVASEVVLGMNIFKDVLANVRDIFGGRSGTVQKTLEEARETAFAELRLKAKKLNADAVISVDIDYHSISTGSAVNMMLVAVSGTAIKFKGTLPVDLPNV